MVTRKISAKGSLLAAITAALPNSLDLILNDDDELRADYTIRFGLGSASINATWVGNGRGVDLGALLAADRGIDLIVGDHLPQSLRDRATAADVSWLDATGAADVRLPGVVIIKPDTPLTPAPTIPVERWNQSTIGTAEAVLTGVTPTVTKLHEATALSRGAVTNALRALTDANLLVAKAARGPSSARSVKSIDALLDAYKAAVNAKQVGVSLHVGLIGDLIDGLARVGSQWDDAGVRWAATGAAAAHQLAPTLTDVSTITVYVDADTPAQLDGVAARGGVRPIKGGRLVLRSFPNPTVRRLATRVDGIRVVSWPRAYVDVHHDGVRGPDAAAHLREERARHAMNKPA